MSGQALAWYRESGFPCICACVAAVGCLCSGVRADLDLADAEYVAANGSAIVVSGFSVPTFVCWNGDDLPDLVVGEGGAGYTGKVRIYLNHGSHGQPSFDAFFYAQANGRDLTEIPAYCQGTFPRVVYWDADEKKDLLIGVADGTVKLYRNVLTDAEPEFDGGTLLPVGPDGAKVDIDVDLRATPIVADWNEDGRKDLVVGAYDGRIHLFLNSGTDSAPNFTRESFAQGAAGDLAVPSARSSPDVNDFDGDGNKDLLSGNTDGELLLYANLGTNSEPRFADGLFVEAGGVKIDLPGAARSRPFSCDWDEDSLTDLLVGAGDGWVLLYRGVTIAGDVDGDGDVDTDDLSAFITVLLVSPGESLLPGHLLRSDVNADGTADGDDIAVFMEILLSQ